MENTGNKNNADAWMRLVMEVKEKMTDALPDSVSIAAVAQAAIMLAGDAIAQANIGLDEVSASTISASEELLVGMIDYYFNIHKTKDQPTDGKE